MTNYKNADRILYEVRRDRALTWLRRSSWIAVVIVLAFLVIWPIWSGIISCGEDVDYSRGAALRGTLCYNFVFEWGTSSFRPIDLLSGRLVNLKTLDARATIVLHLPAMAAILMAIWVAIKRLTPNYRSYFPVAALCWCLHTSTTCVLWQHDTIAQMWASACGLWLGLLVWEAIERAWAGKSIQRHAILLGLLCVLGVLTKEVFFGWVAALDIFLVLTAIVAVQRRNWRVLSAITTIFLAITLIPLGFFALRWFGGGLSEFSRLGGRYKPQFGANLIYNVVLAVMGYFSMAPIHVLRDPAAPIFLRAAPILAIGLNILICIAPWFILRITHRDWPGRPRGQTVAIIAFLTFLGVCATLPIGRISEVYLLGPNAGSAMLTAIGLIGWWQLTRSVHKDYLTISSKIGRAMPIAAGVVLLMIGMYGVASRAYHFQLTWSYARKLDQLLLDHQRSLPPDKNRVITVFLPNALTTGLVHNQYVCPPGKSILLDCLEAWRNHSDPLRQMKLVSSDPIGPINPGDLVVDVNQFPPRRHW